MDWFSNIPPTQFDLLIGKSRDTRRQMRLKGELRSIVLPPRQIADSKQRDQGYVPADAFVCNIVDLLVDQGLSRKAASAALGDIQIASVGVLTDLDDGLSAWLALAHDGKRYLITTAPSATEAIDKALNQFQQIGAG